MFAVVPVVGRPRQAACAELAPARAGCAPGRRLLRPPADVRGGRRGALGRRAASGCRTTPASTASAGRRPSRRSWAAGSTSSAPRPRSAWASTSPTSARSSTGRCPQSPEEYYQQAGRAGRDGLPARCTLLYAKRDKGLIVHFIQRARLAPTDLTAVHAAAAARADERGVFRVREADLGIDEPRVALAVLERAGALELFPAPAGSAAGRIADARLSKRHLAAAVVAGRRVERRRWDRLAAIDGYATEGGCRRAALLRYFSDEPSSVPPDRCCDVCGAAVVRLPDAATPAAAAGGRRRRARARAARGRRDRGAGRAHAHRPDSARIAGAGARRRRPRPARLLRHARCALRRRRAPRGRLAHRLGGARADRRPLPARAPAGRRPGGHRPRRRAARPGSGARSAGRRGGRPVPGPRPGRRRGSRSCGRSPPGRSESSAASAPRRRFGRRRPITTPSVAEAVRLALAGS